MWQGGAGHARITVGAHMSPRDILALCVIIDDATVGFGACMHATRTFTAAGHVMMCCWCAFVGRPHHLLHPA